MRGYPTERAREHGGMSSCALKIIAILAMTLDHTALIFTGHLPIAATSILSAPGGIVFPIMVLLLTEGYRYTSNLRRYALRLLVFACLAEIPYWLFLAHGGNVLFTLLICLAILYLYDHIDNRPAFWLIFILLTAASVVLDWGILGPLMVLILHVQKDRKRGVVYALLIVILGAGIPPLGGLIASGDLSYLPDVLYAFIGGTCSIPLLLTYNGKRGYPLKYIFYAYYPLHIAVIGVVKVLLFGW